MFISFRLCIRLLIQWVDCMATPELRNILVNIACWRCWHITSYSIYSEVCLYQQGDYGQHTIHISLFWVVLFQEVVRFFVCGCSVYTWTGSCKISTLRVQLDEGSTTVVCKCGQWTSKNRPNLVQKSFLGVNTIPTMHKTEQYRKHKKT